jgi:hypothetical protein
MATVFLMISQPYLISLLEDSPRWHSKIICMEERYAGNSHPTSHQTIPSHALSRETAVVDAIQLTHTADSESIACLQSS